MLFICVLQQGSAGAVSYTIRTCFRVALNCEYRAKLSAKKTEDKFRKVYTRIDLHK